MLKSNRKILVISDYVNDYLEQDPYSKALPYITYMLLGESMALNIKTSEAGTFVVTPKDLIDDNDTYKSIATAFQFEVDKQQLVADELAAAIELEQRTELNELMQLESFKRILELQHKLKEV